MSIEKHFDWDSYEAPSYKAPVRFGGLFIVTEALVRRLPYPMRVFGWRGLARDPAYSPPAFEVYDGAEICRPDRGVILEEYEYHEHRVAEVFPRRELTDSEIFKSIRTLFKHSCTEFLDDIHIPALLHMGSYGKSIFNYSLGIARYLDSTVKVSNDWHAIPGGCITTRICSPRTPWAVFLHSDEPGRRGGISHKGNVPSEEYPNGRFAGNRLIRDLEMIGVKTADLVLTPSKLMVDEIRFLAAGHGLPDQCLRKVFAVYHGVDTKLYHPMDVKMPEKRRILYIGRLSPVKGVNRLIESYGILRERFPDLELKLIGDGELRGGVMEFQKTVPDLILDTEWHSVPEKVEEINMATLCVFPSLYEPSGQTHFESMACQKPTVIGNGGWREHTVQDRTAVWVDPRSPADAAEKIGGLLVKDEWAQEIAANARDAVVKYYDWDDVARRAYPHIFGRLLDREIERLKELEDELCPSPKEFQPFQP